MKALTVARAVKKLINVEFKNFDTPVATSPATGGVIGILTLIPQGDTAERRDGRSLLLKSIGFRSTWSLHASATNTSVRMMIILDLQASAGLPTVAEILTPVSIVALMNISTFPGRFRILYDTSFSLSSGAYARKQFKHYQKTNFHIKYAAASSAAQKNAIYQLTISTEATNTPLQTTNYRLRYIDN